MTAGRFTISEPSMEEFPGELWLKSMNARWSVIQLGGSVKIMCEEEEADLGHTRTIQRFLSERDFKLKLANATVTVDGEVMSAAKAWLRDPDRRSYDGIGMYPPPAVCPPSRYNLWRGFGIEPKPGSWPLLHQHFEQILASGKPDHCDYLLQWCAWGLQHLDRKLESAVLLIGKQGGGKGTLGNVLLRCYGRHGDHLSKKDQLVGKHNGHLANCLFLHVDEAFFGGDRASAGALKALMTERRMQIEPKYVDSFQVPNRLRMLFTSNEGHALHLDTDDRRVAAFETAWPWKSRGAHLEYFRRLYDEIDNGGAEAFLHDMLQMQLDGFDPRVLPVTQAKTEQKVQSLHGAAAWWHDALCSGTLWEVSPGRPIDALLQIAKTHPYEQYIEWAKQRRTEYRIDDVRTFWKVLRGLVRVVEFRGTRDAGLRVRCVHLPNLTDARLQFADAINAAGLSWDEANIIEEWR